MGTDNISPLSKKMVCFLLFLSYSLVVSLGQADTQISREEKRIQYGGQPAYLRLVQNNNEIEAADSLVDNQDDIHEDKTSILVTLEEEPTDVVEDETEPTNEVSAVVQEDSKQNTEILNSLAIKELLGFDLINRTRWSADVMKLNLQTMAQNQEGLQFVKDLIDTNPCVSNQEGFLALIEHGTRVVENARPELEKIIINIASFRGERHVSVILRKSADLLVQIENLFPKLQPITFLMQCKSSVEEGLYSMRELILILYRMSETESNIFSEAIKDKMLKSAHIMEVFTNLMDHFQENLSQRDCLTNKNFMGFGVDLAVKTLKDVAEVVGNLGYFPQSKQIRQHAAFTKSSLKIMETMEDFRLPDDCSSGALTRGAIELNDLADIVDNVGLESLAMELGIVFRLDLLP